MFLGVALPLKAALNAYLVELSRDIKFGRPTLFSELSRDIPNVAFVKLPRFLKVGLAPSSLGVFF